MRSDSSRSSIAEAAEPAQTAGPLSANSPVMDSGSPKIRRLIAGQHYFGLDAVAFYAGVQRVIARTSASPAPIDMDCLGEDFGLDLAATRSLVRALLAGALLRPDGRGGYRPTKRFREYALAFVVAPLKRARAKTLLTGAREVAERINAERGRNPYVVWMVAVAGDYMTRRKEMHELSLWLVLRRRPQRRRSRWRSSLPKEEALREIVSAMKALSSFVVVSIAPDRERVQRPFTVVFQMVEETIHPHVPPWEWVREWTASISRRMSKPARAPKTERLPQEAINPAP